MEPKASPQSTACPKLAAQLGFAQRGFCHLGGQGESSQPLTSCSAEKWLWQAAATHAVLQAPYSGKAWGCWALPGLGGALQGCLARAQSEMSPFWSLLCPGRGMVGGTMERSPLGHRCKDQISQKVMRETEKRRAAG